ncbi:hypothetical protein K2173_001984 [Erythroxylum novogranatense]|uniref:Exocyst subunit Exo70 family protein n=1 Tax=Erythroxylum novogranatense TaxID=1862640 RepID=A0AAV8SP75_9ROSI|nr:hypothetical protein K2173_001984 [Erythroxylum novogranatense]
MPRKGMKSLCFHSKTTSFAVSPSHFSTPRRSFSESKIEMIIETADSMIMRWNPDSSTYASVTSLFYEDKREAVQFLKCVKDLQKAMHLLASENSTDHRLVRAQTLMQTAMKRLQKEFYQILSMNRAHLDPESVSTRSSRASTISSSDGYDDEDDIQITGDSIVEVENVSAAVIADLKSIAECMISCGYTKECIKVYKIIRKSIIDEGIYKLGVERLSSSKVNKLSWEVLELKIKNWLEAMKIAMRTLFTGERILCDAVFAVSDSIRESCFTEISREGATLLFNFPEIVAKRKRSSPERMFLSLDMYTSISKHWPEIEEIFSFESCSVVRSQALASFTRLTESVRHMLAEFESTILKDSSKTLAPGGGLHPLTKYAMEYIVLLGDYSNVIADIITDWPPPKKSSLPESYFDSSPPEDSPESPLVLRFAWLILVLLCKLDGKAQHYKDVSVAYLFLANNVQHVASKVRTSNLVCILGDDWVTKHEAKVRQFAGKYERLAWAPVVEILTEKRTAAITAEEVKDMFKRFNPSFEEAYRKQTSRVIPDPKLRDEVKVSISRNLTSPYRELFEKHRRVRVFVKYAPEDIENYLSDLFFGTILAGDSPSSSSAPSSHRRHART